MAGWGWSIRLSAGESFHAAPAVVLLLLLLHKLTVVLMLAPSAPSAPSNSPGAPKLLPQWDTVLGDTINLQAMV